MNKKQAVALEYDKEKAAGAPRIVAVGQGHVAEKIIAMARDCGVPVYQDVEVVKKLIRLPQGSEIPPELYQAVARVLAFIYGLEAKSSRNRREGV